MGRKSSRKLVGSIAKALGDSPQSIKEIAEIVDADRKAVTRYLEELKDSGLIKEVKEGRSRKFYVARYEQGDTYFGLPLTKEQRLKLYTLFSTIRDKYAEKFGSSPTRAKAQKIAVRVLENSDTNLNVPYGNYKYGSMTLLVYEPSRSYPRHTEVIPNWSQVEKNTEEAINFYSDTEFDLLRKLQYSERDMNIYLAKEEILQILTGRDSPQQMEEKLYDFVSYTPELDKDAHEILIDFVAIAPSLIGHSQDRAKCCEIFQSVWAMMAIYNLYEDLKPFYPKSIVEDRLQPEKEEKKEEALAALSEVVGVETRESVSAKFRKHQGSGRELSKKEKEERKGQIENGENLDVAGKFDIDS